MGPETNALDPHTLDLAQINSKITSLQVTAVKVAYKGLSESGSRPLNCLESPFNGFRSLSHIR